MIVGMADNEYTPQLLQCLLDSVANAWCAHNLPTPSLERTNCLSRALEISLGMSEADQHLCIKQVLSGGSVKVNCALDEWLQQIGLTHAHYIAAVSNMGIALDGLFIWLIVQCLGVHLNLIHLNGIWSTRRSGIPDLHDTVIVFVLDYYLAVPSVQLVKGMCNKDKLSTSENRLELDCFSDPLDYLEQFVLSPPNLN